MAKDPATRGRGSGGGGHPTKRPRGSSPGSGPGNPDFKVTGKPVLRWWETKAGKKFLAEQEKANKLKRAAEKRFNDLIKKQNDLIAQDERRNPGAAAAREDALDKAERDAAAAARQNPLVTPPTVDRSMQGGPGSPLYESAQIRDRAIRAEADRSDSNRHNAAATSAGDKLRSQRAQDPAGRFGHGAGGGNPLNLTGPEGGYYNPPGNPLNLTGPEGGAYNPPPSTPAAPSSVPSFDPGVGGGAGSGPAPGSSPAPAQPIQPTSTTTPTDIGSSSADYPTPPPSTASGAGLTTGSSAVNLGDEIIGSPSVVTDGQSGPGPVGGVVPPSIVPEVRDLQPSAPLDPLPSVERDLVDRNTQTPPPEPNPENIIPFNVDSYAWAESYLREQFDLPGMGNWLEGLLANYGGNINQSLIDLEIRNTEQFQERFGTVMNTRRDKGLPAISAQSILDFERTATAIMRASGLPRGFYDEQEDFHNLLIADVSATELEERIQTGFERVSQAPISVRQAYADYFGVKGDEGLAAFLLDPERAVPVLEREVTMAEIGGAGARFGIDVDAGRANELAAVGVDRNLAFTGFARLDAMKPLFDETVGEGTDLTAENEGIDSQFLQKADASRKIERRGAQRRAGTSGGGGAAVTQRGAIGLGVAPNQ